MLCVPCVTVNKGFLGNMTENLQADCVQSRQAGFMQCFPNFPEIKKAAVHNARRLFVVKESSVYKVFFLLTVRFLAAGFFTAGCFFGWIRSMMPENGGSSSVNCMPVRVTSPTIACLLSSVLP